MKRFLLLTTLLTGISTLSVNAETKYYAGNPDEIYGLMTGISDNGKYAAVADEEDNVAMLWNAENPTEFQILGDDALLYDVADNGTAVGSLYLASGKYRAAYYKDGEWERLAEHPEVLNEQYAIAITPDARVIAGYEYDRDKDADQGGRYFPVVWTWDENTKEYELTKFNDLKLPDHQGFVANTLTPDGKYIGGRLYCGSMSEIPAMIDIENHEIIYWNELDTRLEPFYYKGNLLGYFEEYYVDGYHDTRNDNTFSGEFMSSDGNGNFYGYRTVALSVSEDGQDATLANYATIYNVNTKQFTDISGVTAFSLGYDNGKTMFADGATMVTVSETGEVTKQAITDALGFSTTDDISAVTHGSADGKVLGGIYGIFNAAKQAPDYHPFIIVLEEPLAGISEISIDNGSNIAIIAASGRIEVAGAKSVAVYDLNGKCVSTSASSEVAAGIYVVKADNVSKKVIVK